MNGQMTAWERENSMINEIIKIIRGKWNQFKLNINQWIYLLGKLFKKKNCHLIRK